MVYIEVFCTIASLLYFQSTCLFYIASFLVLTNFNIIYYNWFTHDTFVGFFFQLRMLFCQSHWTVSQDSGVWIDRHFLPAVCRYKFKPYHPCCFVAKLFLILGSSQIMSVTEVSTSLPLSPSVVWDIHILRSLLLFVIFCTCLSQMLVYNVQALGRGNVSYILPFFFY